MDINFNSSFSSLRQGLVGAWCPSLPNGGSGNLLVDQSQRGNHGTLTNMSASAWVSGQYGRALNFDGSDDRVNVVRTPAYESTTFSASCWINLNATTEEANRMIFGSLAYDGVAYTGGWNIGKRRSNATDGNANKLYWIYITQTTAKASYSVSVAPTNKFIHAALVYNGSSFIGYLNGEQQFIDTDTFAPNTQRNLSVGGNDSNNFDVNHSGFLDDIRIYNRALFQSEIRLLASRPGIGLQPSPTKFIAREKKTGLRRKILTGLP